MNESGVLDFASDGLLYDISAMYEGADSMPLDSITFKSEGKPVAYSAANEVLSLYYNKDMFDAAGLDYPSATEAMTWDEFVTLAKTLTSLCLMSADLCISVFRRCPFLQVHSTPTATTP